DKFTIIQTTGTILASSRLEGYIGATRAPIPQDGTVFINGSKFILHYNTNSVVLTRGQVSSTVAITSSATPSSIYGKRVIFTALVTPEPGGVVPATGATVTFIVDKGTPFQQTSAPIPVINGQASFDPQALFGAWSVPSTRTIDADFTDANAI